MIFQGIFLNLNMIPEKFLTVPQLKYSYDTRHGFVFKGSSPSSDRAIEDLCRVLVSKKIAETLPEFIVKLNNLTTAFVYPEGSAFESGAFYKAANGNQFFKFWEVDSLAAWLKLQNN